MLTLSRREIHLRLVRCEASLDERLLRRCRQLLCETELARAARFKFPLDRQRYLLTRALVRTSLSLYAPVKGEDWRFRADRHGRPDLIQPHPAGVCFNVSHTQTAILLALSRADIGVDIERLQARSASLRIAARYFSAEEWQALRDLPPESQQPRFLALWTLKEAYLKARGRGLSMALDDFRFQIHGSELQFIPRARIDTEPSRWSFRLLQIGADHVASVCATRRGAERLTLVGCEVVPTLGEQPLQFVELASTD